MNISARSEVRVSQPAAWAPGNGTSYTHTRVINGKRFCFTFVQMQDGECRYSVSRFDAPLDAPNFGCNWTRLHFITINGK